MSTDGQENDSFPSIFKGRRRRTWTSPKTRCSADHLTLSPVNLIPGSSKSLTQRTEHFEIKQRLLLFFDDKRNLFWKRNLTGEIVHPKKKTKKKKSCPLFSSALWMETQCRFDVARSLKRKENSSQGHRRLLEVHLRCRKNVSLRPGSGILTRFPFDRLARLCRRASLPPPWKLPSKEKKEKKPPSRSNSLPHSPFTKHLKATFLLISVALDQKKNNPKRLANKPQETKVC